MKIDDIEIREELYYTDKHSWIKIEEKICKVGVTDYFQKMVRGWAFRAPSELVYIELPKKGSRVSKSDSIASIESVKAVSDLSAPLSGDIIEVNEELIDAPELIGESPYDDGWIVIMKPFDFKSEIKSLMNVEDYCKHLEKLIEARKSEIEKEYEKMMEKVGLKKEFLER